jgi:Glycosyl transferases group 1
MSRAAPGWGRSLRRLRSLTIASGQYGYALSHFAGALARRPRAAESPPGPTWPVSRETRTRLSIGWPMTYGWPLAGHWVEAVRAGLAALVPVTVVEIEQPYEGAVLIEVMLDGTRHEIAIDYFDRSRLLEEVAARCALVFKMQYAAGGYGSSHVIPGGYVPGKASIYRYQPALHRIRDHARPRFEVYGRFGAGHGQEIRRRALALLSDQRRFQFEGSMVTRPYAAYLRETALSQVCIDLPGNGDMCHRLVDYLAVGCAVVRPQPETVLHVPLTDGVNVRFAEPDMSNLVELCASLLSDDSERNRMALAARDYHERYLRPDQLAGYYVDRCVSALSG